jgi:hypothetical protein
MPICEADPWRLQYFAHIPCPDHVRIPTEDSDAWLWTPRHRWVYDKLAVALSQGLEAGPHGVVPQRFPVFSKPIINLRGMGAGSRVIVDSTAYERYHTPGHFWSPLLSGRHVSSDVALVDGRPVWWRHATGTPSRDGMFAHWVLHAAADVQIESHAGRWLESHLAGYTGLANLETIGGTIIEVHLRFADQWPDLYGAGWVEAAIALYAGNGWTFDDRNRRDGYSLALFGPHGRRYRYPSPDIVRRLTDSPGVSSVQITFHQDRAPEQHAMPPGGFRLAIINGTDFDACTTAREHLRRHFLGNEPAVNLI